MDLTELVNLITIRQYVVNSTANPAIDRATVNLMNGMLLMVDKKIIALIDSEPFKDYVNYQDVQAAKIAVAQITNIKSGLNKK